MEVSCGERGRVVLVVYGFWKIGVQANLIGLVLDEVGLAVVYSKWDKQVFCEFTSSFY